MKMFEQVKSATVVNVTGIWVSRSGGILLNGPAGLLYILELKRVSPLVFAAAAIDNYAKPPNEMPRVRRHVRPCCHYSL
jgi:hypothetical protein